MSATLPGTSRPVVDAVREDGDGLADLVVWDADPVSLAGALTDPVEAWLRCGPARAWTTVVGGRVLVDEGQLQLAGLADVLRAHRRVAADLQGVALR